MPLGNRRTLLASIATGFSCYGIFQTTTTEDTNQPDTNNSVSEDTEKEDVECGTVTDQDETADVEEGNTESESDSESDSHTEGTDSQEETENEDGNVSEDLQLNVSIEEMTDVFEGSVEYVSFTVENPTSEVLTEQVTVERDSYTTLFDSTLSVDPGEILEQSTAWHVRHDAAGHAMTLTVSGAEDTDEIVVSGRPGFSPAINDVVSVDNETATVEFTIENVGSAPGSHDVDLTVGDNVQYTDTVYLGIGMSETVTETIPVSPGDQDVSVSTETSTVIETITIEGGG